MQWCAAVEAHDSFEPARRSIESSEYDLVVTNLRLDAYNGLHLVYLLKLSQLKARAIVYGESGDVNLALEAQRAGAFFELRQRVPFVLRTYVTAALPDADRRSPSASDRRALPRGGRRAWDRHRIANA